MDRSLPECCRRAGAREAAHHGRRRLLLHNHQHWRQHAGAGAARRQGLQVVVRAAGRGRAQTCPVHLLSGRVCDGLDSVSAHVARAQARPQPTQASK